MNKNRLEAFSDGVVAILITILVLELKIPHGSDWSALRPLLPVFLTYVLSFIFLAIYWNNHNHMLQATERINGKILWANTHLLFWLSLVPFVTGWGRESLRRNPHRRLRHGPPRRRDRAHDIVEMHSCRAETGLASCDRGGQGPQGKDFAVPVRGGGTPRIHQRMDCRSDLRYCRSDLAGARPPD